MMCEIIQSFFVATWLVVYFGGAETWIHQPGSSVDVATANVMGSRKSKVEVEPPGNRDRDAGSNTMREYLIGVFSF